jgi:feruloyl esterase
MGGAQPFGTGTDLFRYVVFQNPNWDFKTFNFDSDLAATRKADNGTMDALDPNLKPYFDRGGKIIQYHGWTDPQISPGNSVTYYNSVVKALGGANRVSGNYRLFMVPGMNHCGGGDGTADFDMLTALEQWVENGKAPIRSSRRGSLPEKSNARGRCAHTRRSPHIRDRGAPTTRRTSSVRRSSG